MKEWWNILGLCRVSNIVAPLSLKRCAQNCQPPNKNNATKMSPPHICHPTLYMVKLPLHFCYYDSWYSLRKPPLHLPLPHQLIDKASLVSITQWHQYKEHLSIIVYFTWFADFKSQQTWIAIANARYTELSTAGWFHTVRRKGPEKLMQMRYAAYIIYGWSILQVRRSYIEQKMQMRFPLMGGWFQR